MSHESLFQGAELRADGVRYCIWAPVCKMLEVEILGADGGVLRKLPLAKNDAGFFEGVDGYGAAGDLYKYRLDEMHSFPDPASRYQPHGVHGPSMVVDEKGYAWNDPAWRRCPFRDLVIYELHIGGFTPEGTFRAAIERLPHVRSLGATAIEIMPIGDFPGQRNWGYDGVFLYAPARAYGTPDDLRALVDAAHQIGLTVILDVVYNHFGPDGNYLGAYIGDYLNEARKTPWGGAIRYGDPRFAPLREMVVANPRYWMREFHIDGFRVDATHAIADLSPSHILRELNEAIHALGGFSIAEDSRNDSRVLLPKDQDGLGFDGVWADDFHHIARVANTREHESYLRDFLGSLDEMIDVLRHGWFYRGQFSQNKGANRGTECRHIAPQAFVHCISNHDQIGNRAMGDRFSDVVSAEAYRACSALLCLTPYTPLLFMGQEWMASTPFLFFTNHHAELGEAVANGRREEFKGFEAFRDPHARRKIPNPQKVETFEASKLRWEELREKNRAPVLELYRACLALRKAELAFRPQNRDRFQVEELQWGVGAMRLKDDDGDWLLLCDVTGGHGGSLQEEWVCEVKPGRQWSVVLSSNERRFGGSGPIAFDPAARTVQFPTSELLVLREVEVN